MLWRLMSALKRLPFLWGEARAADGSSSVDRAPVRDQGSEGEAAMSSPSALMWSSCEVRAMQAQNNRVSCWEDGS